MEPKEKKKFKINFRSMFRFWGLDADSDWRFIGVVFGSLFIVVSIINIFLFIHFSFLTKNESLEESKFELIDRQKLTEIIERFDKRTEEFNKIKESISAK